MAKRLAIFGSVFLIPGLVLGLYRVIDTSYLWPEWVRLTAGYACISILVAIAVYGVWRSVCLVSDLIEEVRL